MIRINLYRGKNDRKKRSVSAPSGGGGGGGNTLAVVFLLVIFAELGGLYYWSMQVEESTQAASGGTEDLKAEVEALKKNVSDKKKFEKLEKEMNKQRAIFEVLEHGKVGPLHMMLYASYALRKVDLESMPQEEYKVLADLWKSDKRSGSGAGRTASDFGPDGSVNEGWNPDSVWVTEIKEVDGAMTISGEAKTHRDVMIFLDRLKTSIYFEGVDLVNQKINRKSRLKQEFIEFKLKCELNYDPRQYPML